MQSNIFHEDSGKRIKGVVETGRQPAGIIVGGCSREGKQKAGSEAKGVAGEERQASDLRNKVLSFLCWGTFWRLAQWRISEH